MSKKTLFGEILLSLGALGIVGLLDYIAFTNDAIIGFIILCAELMFVGTILLTDYDF